MNKNTLTIIITTVIVITYSIIFTGIALELVTAYINNRELLPPMQWEKGQRMYHVVATLITIIGSVFIKYGPFP